MRKERWGQGTVRLEGQGGVQDQVTVATIIHARIQDSHQSALCSPSDSYVEEGAWGCRNRLSKTRSEASLVIWQTGEEEDGDSGGEGDMRMFDI